jgi:hypothetical protein
MCMHYVMLLLLLLDVVPLFAHTLALPGEPDV